MSQSIPESTPARTELASLPRCLARLSLQIAEERDPIRALSLLIASLRRELRIDRAGVFAYDRQRQVLEHLTGIDTQGQPEVMVETIPLTNDHCPLLQVAHREIPYYISQQAPRDYPRHCFGDGVQALAILPVIAGGELVGMLCADNCLTDRSFDEGLLEPLILYTGLASIPLFARYERREHERQELLRRAICGDMLYTVSGGKISLCTRDQILEEWPAQAAMAHVTIREPSDIRQVREMVHRVMAQAGMDTDRAGDFALCVSEAATNALLHGMGGVASVAAQNGCIRARIEDRGTGISLDQLPSATLVKGWSSKRSMGLGFTVMVETTDRIFLNTGGNGTTLILEMGVTAPAPELAFDPMLWGEGIEI